MEMHQIRYMLAVCQTRNFTRAARRCGVSQPSLTKAIKALEQQLGTRLFHRDRRGVQLTGAGARLRPHFEEIARRVSAIQEDMARDTAPDMAQQVKVVEPAWPAAAQRPGEVVPSPIIYNGIDDALKVPAE